MHTSASQFVSLLDLKPHLRLVHDFRAAEPLHLHEVTILDHALHYFVSGTGTYTLGGINHPIHPRALFLTRPGQIFSLHTDSTKAVHMLNIHFDPVAQADSAEILWPYPKAGQPPRDPDPVQLDPVATSIPAVQTVSQITSYADHFQELRLWWEATNHSTNPIAQLKCRAAFLNLICLTVQPASQPTLPVPEVAGALLFAHRFIETNYSKPIRLADIAQAAHISPSHLTAQFNRVYGLSPIKYLTRFRLEKAREELAFGTAPIKEISSRYGYTSVAHFTRAFSNEFGVPPAEFRRLQAD